MRSERIKKLNEDETDATVEALKNLNDIISEYQPNGDFDPEIFDEIVELITVEDSAEMTFHLLGDLRLTETIRERGRCKTA